MSFIIGKLTRKVSKQHNEYYVGKICNLPVRASWTKKNQDDLCIFLDLEKIKFLSEQNKPESGPAAAPSEEQHQ
ncbi:MAG: hypothetical protein C4533_00070 [Candidatus Omnitrophota bacterium]|nr:MAG: hypothetical protein C4533_00070 [Candidatus Omnitrophota bacterium]